MGEQIAREVGPSRIQVAYERFGDPEAAPVLLVMGLGGQMIAWPEGFCAGLVARGLQPIRFDNRDAGRSTHFSDRPAPDLAAGWRGDFSTATYTLADMAADAIGLLDVLQIDRAHVVGASMGGQIAQIMATAHPQRVRSLVSMMSWTGSSAVGQPSPEIARLAALPPTDTRERAMDNMVAALRIIGSPGFPLDEAAVRERTGLAFDRGHDPAGVQRQAMATMASGDRTAQLRDVTVPTLVIHGAEDRMCDVSGGRATAAAIPGAELVIIDGMGHNLPRELWPRLATLIADHAHQADSRAA